LKHSLALCLAALALLGSPSRAAGLDRSIYAAALGGADILNGDSAALGELRLRGSLGQTGAAAAWSAWYLGDLLGWFPDAAADSHFLEVQGHTFAPLAPGAALTARGSASGGWLELMPSASVQLTPDPGDLLLLRLGPALRSGDQASGIGLGTTALFSTSTTPRLRFDLRADARGWSVDDAPLPRTVLELDGGTRWSPRPALALMASAGIARSGGDATPEPLFVAGTRPAGSNTLRGWTAAELDLGRGLAVRLEVTGERTRGSLEASRLKIAVGLSGRSSRLGHPRAPVRPAETLFTLSVDAADEVLLTSSYNDWAPLPMARGEGGSWRLTVTLPPGTHEYAYLVDGVPLTPPEATTRRDDGFGGENGVLVVVGTPAQSAPVSPVSPVSPSSQAPR